jgi:hypothetical protein
MSCKHTIYNKVKLAHKHLKSEKLYKETFQMSAMLAKLAQEQLEIENPGFQQYRCSICGKGEHHESMFAAHPKHLEYYGITPIYKMPEHTAYPVCSSCNTEHFHEHDEISEPQQPDYSGHRRGNKINHQCMRCRKALDKTENYSWESFDFARIHNIGLTEDHIAMEEALGSNNELPLCTSCETELEDEEEKKCAVCGEMEDQDDMMEVDRQLILDSDNHPEYTLDDDNSYPVCHTCYDEMHERCDICGEGHLSSEMESETWPNGNSQDVCESCREGLDHCDTCGAAIDASEDLYDHSEDGYFYCENHMPTNDNDFEQLDADAESSLEKMNPVNLDYHISVNPKIIQKLERTFGHALKKYKGEYLPDKVGRHIMKIIDQLAIEEGERKHLKEFLWHQPLEPGQAPKAPLKMDRLALLLGHTKQIEIFRDSISSRYDISKKHKFLRDLMPIPVIVSVEEPHDTDYRNSFVVTLSPNDEVEETARTVWGSDGMMVWDMMSEHTHHSGAVAYCRIGNYDGEWLIENLQSDSDVQRIKQNLNPSRGYGHMQNSRYKKMMNDEEYKNRILKIARWWSRQFRGWQPFLMMLVMQMAEDANTELYVTDTAHQKSKWRGIPDRSSIIYDAIPEELHDARMKAVTKEIAEFNGISEEQVTEDMIREHIDIFPRREERGSDQTETDEHLDNDLWRLANKR